MNNSEFAKIQQQVCAKIDYLYEVLRTIQDINAEALYASKKVVERSPFINGDEKINYSIDAISIRISPENIKRFSRIPEYQISNAELCLRLKGVINANLWNEEDKNPWEALTFSTQFKVITMDGELCEKSFHVDQVQNIDAVYNDVHPWCHLHFNGDVEERLSINLPRLVHYPLDMVLGLIVVLQNYAPEKYKVLRTKSQFVSLCHRSQKRILFPYFNSLFYVINKEGECNKKYSKLCPYLL